MYCDKIKSNFLNPENAGRPQGVNATAKLTIDSGEIINFFLKINEDNIVEDAKFKVFGGPVIIAALNILCEMVKGKTLEKCLKIMDYDIINELDKVPEKNISSVRQVKNVVNIAIDKYIIKKQKKMKLKVDAISDGGGAEKC